MTFDRLYALRSGCYQSLLPVSQLRTIRVLIELPGPAWVPQRETVPSEIDEYQLHRGLPVFLGAARCCVGKEPDRALNGFWPRQKLRFESCRYLQSAARF